MPSRDPLIALIHQVRRRWMLAHATRLLVITTMILSIAVAVLAVVLRLVPMSFETSHLALATVAIVVIAVVVDLVRRWPSDVRVARHIDAALELRELLATGLSSTGDDPASQSVRASAFATAGRTKAADVPERFPSLNSVLAAALLLTGALVTNSLMHDRGESEAERARARQMFDPSRGDRIVSEPQAERTSSASGLQRTPREPDETGRDPKPATSADPANAASAMSRDGSARDASGTSRGGTDDVSRPMPADEATAPSSASEKDASTATSGGSVDARTTPAASSLRAGASTPRSASALQPRTESDRGRSGSHSDGNDYGSSDRDGSPAAPRVPDRHRALVRAYFEAEPSGQLSTTRPSTSR